MTKSKLYRQVKKFADDKTDTPILISGVLGVTIDGKKTVEVPNRDGFVWVKLRGSQSELIQVYNTTVSPIYGLPVLVTRQNNRYSIYGRDLNQYQDWGNSSYLPKHGTQHSFAPDLGLGGDITWVYSRQFIPLLAIPSGTFGGPNVVINPHTFKNGDGSWSFIGNTATDNVADAKPTNTSARMMLLYWDLDTNSSGFITGSFFSENITGTSAIVPYLPNLESSQKIPLAGIRLVSGTSNITWDNIYDTRQFALSAPYPFSGGMSIWDEGIPQGTGTVLDFTGAGIQATISGSVVNVNVTATGGGGGGGIGVWTSGSAGAYSITTVDNANISTGDRAVSHGFHTTGSGANSHAEGFEAVAAGTSSHAEGGTTKALGQYSHAEGVNSNAYGVGSHVAGLFNDTYGQYSSVVSGFFNKASGTYSAILAGQNNYVSAPRTSVLAGQGITADIPNTAYTEKMNVSTLSSGTAINNVGIDSEGFLVTGSSGGRIQISADRTYYVRTDGSDSNSGLVNSAGGAFLTIQKAVDVASELDLGIYDVVIQVSSGTHSTASDISLKSAVGSGQIIISGDTTTPSNVIVQNTASGGKCFSYDFPGQTVYKLEGMRVQGTGGGVNMGIAADVVGGLIEFEAIDFGAVAWQIYVSDGAQIKNTGNYTISGNATFHWRVASATLRIESATITLTGTPAFNTFASIRIVGGAIVTNLSFSGSATGKRYDVVANGVIWTNGAGPTYLPGDSAGTFATGGQYV